MISPWQEPFGLAAVPPWLDAFAAGPDEAVDALLRRRFYHGHLDAAEPEDLLVDWAWRLDGALVESLDPALARWVERCWGKPPGGEGPALWADAWATLGTVVAAVGELRRTARALRQRFGEAGAFLGPLSVSPSRDPLGRFYGAVAAHQEDRSLAPFWWQLCDLPEGILVHHARYALEGLRGLPAADLEEAAGGGFRPEVVRGVVRLARAYARLAEEGRLGPPQAKESFLAFGRRELAALPFREQWRAILRTERAPEGEPKAWVEELVPNVQWQAQRRGAGDWSQRAKVIVPRLGKSSAAALREAEQLIEEERRHAQVTGDSYPLVRSLCWFAKVIWSLDPARACVWAEEARLWEPWDAFTWTTLITALQRAGRLEEALEAAGLAVERFPENTVARNGLGDVLKSAGRLPEAEGVYRETMELFPEDDVARNGLGEVLKVAGRLSEAEGVYRETMELFPEDDVSRSGLGEVLKAAGRLSEAEGVYRETMELFPEDVVARTGLAEVLRAAGRLDEAIALYEETTARFPRNEVARRGLRTLLRERETGQASPSPDGASPSSSLPLRGAARISGARTLRRWARRGDGGLLPDELRRQAGELLDEALRETPHDLRAAGEKGLLLVETGQLAAARELLGRHLAGSPAAPPLLAGLARAEREQAAAEGRRLDGGSEAELLAPPQRLRASAPQFAALASLQEGRAFLALTDGQVRRDKAGRAFSQLARKLTQLEQAAAGEEKGFGTWWSGEVRQWALGPAAGRDEIGAPEVDALAEWQHEHAARIDLLEEAFVDRQAAAQLTWIGLSSPLASSLPG